MVQRIPNSLVKLLSAIILTAIPLIISVVAVSPIFDSSEIELTILEQINHTNQESNLKILIQNVGSQASTDLILFVDSKNSYEIINSKSTDKQPEIHADEKLRVEIPRLAPQAYVYLEGVGKAIPASKDVWVTTNDGTELITVPAIGLDLGISSVDLSGDRNSVFIGLFLFGVITLLIFRYYNFYRSEYARREFLGVYHIPLVRFNSQNLIGGFTILMAVIGVGAIIDGIQPELIDGYVAYTY